VNCDYPRSYPSGGEINPIYVNENGKPILLDNVVLVEKNTNALFRYSDKVKYNPSNDNLLWGLTKDNKIAYIKNADFQLLKNSTSKQKVHMHIYNEKVKTYEDIANVLFH
jgi:succinyl-CoA synthetase beta subunit